MAPQGDDYVSSTPPPALTPVVNTPAAAVPDAAGPPAVAAPAELETPETPDTPEQAQRKSDRAFAAQRRRIEAQAVEIAALKARIDAGSQPPTSGLPFPSQPSTTPTPPPVPATRPDPNNYASHEEWVEAMSDWKADQKIAAYHATQEATAQQRRQQADQAAVQQTWQAQEQAVRAQYEDYDEVLEADTTRYHPALLEGIQTSPVGAQLAYHLATHPEDAAALAALALPGRSPAAALRALGKLEARLEGQPATSGSAPASHPQDPTLQPTPMSPARPRPLIPVGGPGGATSTKSPDQMEYDEYVAWYTKAHGTR